MRVHVDPRDDAPRHADLRPALGEAHARHVLVQLGQGGRQREADGVGGLPPPARPVAPAREARGRPLRRDRGRFLAVLCGVVRRPTGRRRRGAPLLPEAPALAKVAPVPLGDAQQGQIQRQAQPLHWRAPRQKGKSVARRVATAAARGAGGGTHRRSSRRGGRTRRGRGPCSHCGPRGHW